MTLGKRQREDLAKLVEMALRPSNEGHIRLEVRIGRPRPYTREFGRGIAITVRAVECYKEGEYPMQSQWIADCQYPHTAEAKGQEIARYLVEQGVARERVRLLR